MPNAKRRLIIFLTGLGLTLIMAGLVPLVAAQDATAVPPAETQEAPAQSESAPAITPTGDNGYCAVCHDVPWRTITLADGETLNLFVSEDLLAGSVHGINNPDGALGCVDCHGQDAFPHSGPTPTDGRTYSIAAVQMCESCHSEQHTDLQQGLHAKAIAEGNLEAAVCTDCHGAHDVQRVAAQSGLVAGVCGDCHKATLTEWRASPHVDIGPLGCANCHSPHTQTLRVGETGDDMCINCHKIMEEQWVHTEHLNVAEPVNCTSCHMYTPASDAVEGEAISVANWQEMPTGHSMVVESVACSTCHEELVASGEWQRIADANATAPETTTGEPTVEGGALVEGEAEATDVNYVPLFQGLILGLGLGITVAAVFIARGNPKSSKNSNNHS